MVPREKLREQVVKLSAELNRLDMVNKEMIVSSLVPPVYKGSSCTSFVYRQVCIKEASEFITNFDPYWNSLPDPTFWLSACTTI